MSIVNQILGGNLNENYSGISIPSPVSCNDLDALIVESIDGISSVQIAYANAMGKMAIAECKIEEAAKLSNAGIVNEAYENENLSEEMDNLYAISEATFKDFIDKICDWFKKAWAAICGFFKKIWEWLKQHFETNKQFIESYTGKLLAAEKKAAGFKFQAYPMPTLDKIQNRNYDPETTEKICNFDTCKDMEELRNRESEVKSVIYTLLGATSTKLTTFTEFADEFKKAMYDGEYKKATFTLKSRGFSVTQLINNISTKNESIKDLKKFEKEANKGYSEILSNLKKDKASISGGDSKEDAFEKALVEARITMYKTWHQCFTKIVSLGCKAVTNASSESKSILLKLLRYKPSTSSHSSLVNDNNDANDTGTATSILK